MGKGKLQGMKSFGISKYAFKLHSAIWCAFQNSTPAPSRDFPQESQLILKPPQEVEALYAQAHQNRQGFSDSVCRQELSSSRYYLCSMIIPLKSSGNLEEWAMVELQGDLRFDSGEINKDQYIGDIHFTKSGAPILIIGIHVLHGKEVPLPKPLAVLKKKRTSTGIENGTGDNETCTEYGIDAIVRKKLVFRSRPKPIATNVPKSI